MTLRLTALALLFLASACSGNLEEPAILAEPIAPEPVPDELGAKATDCVVDEIAGDGIGGTGCPTVD